MIENTIRGVTFFSFAIFSGEKGVFHAITTRRGGVSLPPFHSLNLGLYGGDSIERVTKNYQVLSNALAFTLDFLLMCRQDHGARVIEIKKKDEVRSSFLHSRIEADAMVTSVPGLVLMVRVADCIPLMFLDPLQRVVGIAHAGRRGTLKQIAVNTVNVFIDHYHSHPENILVGIGPGIGPCCYDVDDQVGLLYRKGFSFGERLIEERNGKNFLNLWEANRRQLLDLGIREENIDLAKICTSCHSQIFFSHRREKGRTGRFGALIGIKG